MPKAVVFHIGLPKTGTTSIQKYLRSQEEPLRSLGFLYPGPREHPAMNSYKHSLLLSAMQGNEPPRSGGLDTHSCRAAFSDIFAQFRNSEFSHLIWSHEGISAHVAAFNNNYMRELTQDLDVRIVLSARYIDDWIESFYMERIRAQGGKGKARPEKQKDKQLLPIAPGAQARTPDTRRIKSMLERGADIPKSLRALRKILPSAEIVVQSYDAHRASGTVVSGALAAMGLPVESAFPSADGDAGVRNPTKSNLYSMLIYHLAMGNADADVVRAVTAATKSRNREGLEFAPLGARRFRFLSEENIIEARGYYEALREKYPHLPAQPPYAPDSSERSLSKAEGVALLDWLRPEISDAIFDRACAAYKMF